MLLNHDQVIDRVVVFHGDLEGKEYKNAFTDIGHHGVVGRRFHFFHLADESCAEKLGFTKKPQMMMYRELTSPTPAFYDGKWYPVTMIEWVWAQATPVTFEFTDDNYELVYYQKLPQVILFRMVDWDDKEDYEIAFEEVAAKNKGEYIFVTSGLSEQIQ